MHQGEAVVHHPGLKKVHIAEDYRVFFCRNCKRQVNICSYCDRGNVYCSRRCVLEGRRSSMREAGRRYQATFRGRFHHANRQRAYRTRTRAPAPIEEKVTHQGSPEAGTRTIVAASAGSYPGGKVDSLPTASLEGLTVRCHFCGCPCLEFVRDGFIRRRRRRPKHRPPWGGRSDDSRRGKSRDPPAVSC